MSYSRSTGANNESTLAPTARSSGERFSLRARSPCSLVNISCVVYRYVNPFLPSHVRFAEDPSALWIGASRLHAGVSHPKVSLCSLCPDGLTEGRTVGFRPLPLAGGRIHNTVTRGSRINSGLTRTEPPLGCRRCLRLNKTAERVRFRGFNIRELPESR